MLFRSNATVPADATVWLLGDVTILPAKLGKLLGQLNGRKILVAGNHDQPHPVSLRNKKRSPHDLGRYARAYREAGFAAVHLQGAFDVPDFGRVYVNHYPYSPGADLLGVRIPDDGQTPLLHGHVHEKWRFRGRMLNLSVEVQDYRPLPLRAVRDLLRAERDAGWPTPVTLPEDEGQPVPEEGLSPDRRLHQQSWFLVEPGPEALPDLPEVGQRVFPVPDAAFARFGWPVEAVPTLLEAWIDGVNPDREQLLRRLYLHPRLTLVGSRLLTPYPPAYSHRVSVTRRMADVTRPRRHPDQQLIHVPPFERLALLKWLKGSFTLAEEVRSEEERQVTGTQSFANPQGVIGWIKRTWYLDDCDFPVANSETVDLHLTFPAGTSEREAAEAMLLFSLRLPLRERKPLTLLEPAGGFAE